MTQTAPRRPKKLVPTWTCIYGEHEKCQEVEDYSHTGVCGCSCHNFCTCSCHETANHP